VDESFEEAAPWRHHSLNGPGVFADFEGGGRAAHVFFHQGVQEPCRAGTSRSSGHRASQRRRNAGKGRKSGQARSDVWHAPSLVLAMSARALTIHYSFVVPHDVIPPVSKQTGKPISASDSLAFPLKDQGVFDYKGVVAAIQEAKVVSGDKFFTPWRDAVGDREKGKDTKKAEKVEDEDEDDEGEDITM
jgi:hypothetical protein